MTSSALLWICLVLFCCISTGWTQAGAEEARPIDIKVMGIPGCKNADKADILIRKEAEALHLPIVMTRLEVPSKEDAVRERMSGSPTILVNGLDVDPSHRGTDKFGIT